ncbi:MAG: GFA family protein [Rhodospirillales bacterium]|nr:GFA family protein [Rhodospirillales bacterium]
MKAETITGGCQCGAVRYAIGELGRASICHCRMCQKAFGSFFGPLVSAIDIVWTRGERSIFHSSNRRCRGFCATCGTPLTFEHSQGIEVAIGSLDHPELAAPTVQVNMTEQCRFIGGLFDLPVVPSIEAEMDANATEELISYQHPDHD